METRLATELIAVNHSLDGIRDLLRDRLDVRDKVQDHETPISVLETRGR
jgi:hypothetical protein